MPSSQNDTNSDDCEENHHCVDNKCVQKTCKLPPDTLTVVNGLQNIVGELTGVDINVKQASMDTDDIRVPYGTNVTIINVFNETKMFNCNVYGKGYPNCQSSDQCQPFEQCLRAQGFDFVANCTSGYCCTPTNGTCTLDMFEKMSGGKLVVDGAIRQSKYHWPGSLAKFVCDDGLYIDAGGFMSKYLDVECAVNEEKSQGPLWKNKKQLPLKCVQYEPSKIIF